jgi:hypothetical protein
LLCHIVAIFAVAIDGIFIAIDGIFIAIVGNVDL